jgi:uncharacterized protein (DUF362 family)
MSKKKNEKSIVAITKGGRWEAKSLLKEGFKLMGGINTVAKKGDVVLLKPNLGYVTPEGKPPWTCTTDYMVLAGLTELFLESGAKKVITGDGCGHWVDGEWQFKETGVKEAVEKAGGEVCYFDKVDYVLRKVPGGVLLKEQWVPKICLDVDVIVNVPKVKPTRLGKFTLGYKNMFGCVPVDERIPWHRIPEMFYLLVDLFKLLPPTFTVMDGLVSQEGPGPRYGTPVEWGVIIMGKDPVAVEAVTMLALGHQPYEQSVLAIAAKAGQGTMDINRIDIRGQTIEAAMRYHRVAPGDILNHPDPRVVEYVGGACFGCGLWIQYTPFPWEFESNKKYALVVGNTPRLPDVFEEDEVIVMGNCAIRSKTKIESACDKSGIRPRYIGGCPPYEKLKTNYWKLHGTGPDSVPLTTEVRRIKEREAGPRNQRRKGKQK